MRRAKKNRANCPVFMPPGNYLAGAAAAFLAFLAPLAFFSFLGASAALGAAALGASALGASAFLSWAKPVDAATANTAGDQNGQKLAHGAFLFEGFGTTCTLTSSVMPNNAPLVGWLTARYKYRRNSPRRVKIRAIAPNMKWCGRQGTVKAMRILLTSDVALPSFVARDRSTIPQDQAPAIVPVPGYVPRSVLWRPAPDEAWAGRPWRSFGGPACSCLR